ncbi:MAG: hypothetical protein LBE83_02630, partial [Propionibacteriaceae bacterium]|nr:hypothetical protein [Propionibacteriaceae bacterium]
MKVRIGAGFEAYSIETHDTDERRVIQTLTPAGTAVQSGQFRPPLGPHDRRPGAIYVRAIVVGDQITARIVDPAGLLSGFNQFSFAWHLVCGKQVQQRIWYQDKTQCSWTLERSGCYRVQLFVKSLQTGEIETILTTPLEFPPSLPHMVLNKNEIARLERTELARESLRAWLVACLAAGGDPFTRVAPSDDVPMAVWTTSDLGIEFARAGYYRGHWVDVIGGGPSRVRGAELVPVVVSDDIGEQPYSTILVLDVPSRDLMVAKRAHPEVRFIEMLPMLQAEYDHIAVIEPLRRLVQTRRGVKILVCNGFSVKDVGNPSPHEQQLAEWTPRYFSDKGARVHDPIWAPHGQPRAYALQTRAGPLVRLRGGLSHLADRSSEYYNVAHGIRATSDAPSQYERTVWVFGPTAIRGAGADDTRTIPSELQRMCNKARLAWRVMNCSNYNGSTDEQAIRMMETQPVQEGDICIFMVRRQGLFEALSQVFASCDLGTLFARPHNMGEVFWDSHSVNAIGNQAVAIRLFTAIGKKDWAEPVSARGSEQRPTQLRPALLPTQAPLAGANQTVSPPRTALTTPSTPGLATTSTVASVTSVPDPSQASLSSEELLELQTYLENLIDVLPAPRGPRGSLVMNCNPFTMGHRYFVERA